LKNIIILSGLVLLILFAFVQNVSATHVAGGTMSYKCLGNDSYEVTLEFRRDCFNGAENAQFDSLASVSIFDSEGELVVNLGEFGNNGEIRIPFMGDDTLNEILTSECNVIGGDRCVQTTIYRSIPFILPPRPGGYILAYQRCCRNGTLNNIIDPTLTGATYWVKITESALEQCNNSPRFTRSPASFICIDDTLRFDHSAFDVDGDSLVYFLCTPSAGATVGNPKPQPANPPPFETVDWAPGFSENNMMGGSPISIDSQTGQIIAVPNMVGQFLIGICVREFRDGELLSEIRRDFEYNVRVCGRDPIAIITPTEIQDCDGYTVEFDNETTSNFLPFDSLDFRWIFDFPDGNLVREDDVRSITFTYPNAGAYTVALVTTDGVCTDTAYAEVKVATPQDLVPEFEVGSFNCDSSVSIQLFDRSSAFLDILEYEWIVINNGNIDTLYGPEPILDIGEDGNINVSLTVVDETECPRSISRNEQISTLRFESEYVDKIICDGERAVIYTAIDPAYVVEIEPSAGVTTDGNGTYFIDGFNGEQEFIVEVSDGFCFDVGRVIIEAVSDPSYPFEDIIQCGDDLVTLNPNGPDFYIYNWVGPPNVSFPSNEANPVVSLEEKGTFYVTVSTSVGSLCRFTDSVTVNVIEDPEFNIFPAEQFIYCENTTVEVSIDSNLSDITWIGPGGQVLATGPTLVLDNLSESLVVDVRVINEFGCITTKSTDIQFVPEPPISIDITQSALVICEGETATAIVTATDSVVWTTLNGGFITSGPELILTGLTADQSYIATAINDLGCEKSIQVDIEVNVNPIPNFSALEDILICPGEVGTIVLDSPFDITWFDTNGNLLFTGSEFTIQDILGTTEFIAVATNQFGCETSQNFLIEVDPLKVPEVDLSPLIGQAVCMETDIDLMVEVNATDMVSWLDINGNVLETGNSFSVLALDTTTQYQISVVDEGGCELRDTFEVEVYQQIDLTIDGGQEDLFYCEGSSLNLQALTDVDADVTWTNNGDTISTGMVLMDFFPTENVEVIAFSEDEFGCIESDTFNVRESLIGGLIQGDDVTCIGQNASLEFIPEHPNEEYTLTWGPSDLIVATDGNFASVSVEGETVYSVVYTNTDNCTSVHEFTVEEVGFFNGVIAFAEPESILLGQSSQLSIDQDMDFTHMWEPTNSLDDPNIADPIATPEETTTYFVTITDSNGCVEITSVTVEVEQPSCDENDIFVPNMFTPNNDGENDEFEVHSNFIDQMRLIVYNRWGEEVFVSTDQANKWNGTYQNKELEPDVYGYHLTATCINGFDYTTQGNVTLMK